MVVLTALVLCGMLGILAGTLLFPTPGRRVKFVSMEHAIVLTASVLVGYAIYVLNQS